MNTYWPFLIVGAVAAALIVWNVLNSRGSHRAWKAALAQIGFSPCLDQKSKLEEIITRIENNQGFRYEVRNPKQLAGDRPCSTPRCVIEMRIRISPPSPRKRSCSLDLVDMNTLSVVQGLGDAGGILVRFRDSWCTVASTSGQIPFRLEELIARIRPLL